MYNLNKKSRLQLGIGVLPAIFTVIAYFKSPYWIIGTAVTLFALVGILPFCRHRQNLWMFLFVGVFSIPVNISLTKSIALSMLSYETPLCTIINAALVFFVLFSVEEVAFAAVTRIIWRKQYRLFPSEFNNC